jgi:uncharacterized membrane protein YbhN (UPF0104 family)
VRRQVVSWVLSIVGGVLFLWLASRRIDLWPSSLEIPRPALLWAAAALHVPYALLRAMRLAYVFDPLVTEATGRQARIDRRVLYGSGFVSFLVLIVLPFKLGELSRPLLLVKGRQPGVGMAESLSAVATERIVDGLLICGMLFGGLALSDSIRSDSIGDLADVRHVGRLLLLAFIVGLGVLAWAARDVDRSAEIARGTMRRLSPRLADRVASLTRRFAGAVQSLLQTRRAAAFVAWSAGYWALTIVQLWLVLHACGLTMGVAEASAIVAIVGLSIQLPGGPAQTGTFQVGASLALSLFVTDAVLAGAGSSFTAVMYLLQLLGAVAMAVPGVALLAAARARAGEHATPDA